MNRSAGILCPVFSIPANQGIGDLGQKTIRMIDIIADAGYTIWQILPLQMTGPTHSPYQTYSSFAGDPIYINLDRLCEMGLLTQSSIVNCNKFKDFVEYDKIREFKESYFQKAFKVFKKEFDSFKEDFELMANSFPLLLAGAAITVEITAMSVTFGLLIGCMIGIARLCSIKPLRYFANVYVDFIRGTPLLVQIFLVYFALPNIIGSRVDPFVAAISACSINSGAYVAEIFRAGIQSIDKGQMEAGRSLGMTWAQTMRYIIMPQAFKRIIPPLGNEFIAMLKDSSLVSVIGFEELTRRGQLIIARTYASFEIWMAVAIIYLIMTFAVARFTGYLERRFDTK